MASPNTQQRVLVKCGGFSTQLACHVGERIDGDPLWGSRFDWVNPTAVVQTHLDFLQSKYSDNRNSRYTCKQNSCRYALHILSKIYSLKH